MSISNIKILYVVTHMPCPPMMGAHHRVLNIGRQLKKCGAVTMVYAGGDFSSESLEATRREFGEIIVMKPALIKGQDAIARLRYKFNFHWPWHCGYKVTQAEQEHFEQLRREHDLVWFHTLPAANCFSINNYARSVMDLDDLNQVKFELKSRIDRGVRLKIANRLLVYKWERLEKKSLDRFSLVTVCSDDDKSILLGGKKIHVIPNGFESPRVEPDWHKPGHLRIGFIGNLSYGPNADGLKWFAEEIWPLITRQVPQVRLRIVGRVPEQADYLNKSGYEKLGFLKDTTEEFTGWSAMIVPLRYGGGTRLKIIEALSKKCPIVSTPSGAHGLEMTHGKDILMAEQPRAFADSCIKLLTEPDYGKQLARDGWYLFTEKYTWDVIGETIKQVVHEGLNIT